MARAFSKWEDFHNRVLPCLTHQWQRPGEVAEKSGFRLSTMSALRSASEHGLVDWKLQGHTKDGRPISYYRLKS